MILKKYLDQATRIRKEYLNISNDLYEISEKFETNKNSIEKTLEGLIKIRENSDTYVSDSDYTSDIMEKLKEFEEQQTMIENVYKPLNDKMEKLQDEESKLFNEITKQYPNINHEELVIEIQDYVKERVNK